MTPEETRAYHREWSRKKREADPEAWAAKKKAQRLANYERVRASERASREKNIDKHRADSRERMRKARAERPEQLRAVARKSRFMSKYGMTVEQHAEMLTRQGNLCAICRTNNLGKVWHTDHCHTTGRVRGILCSPCNLMLGHAADDPERLRQAAEYIERAINGSSQ